MKRIFLLNVGLSANYKVSWPNIFKIECPFASFENYIPTKKFLTHKSLFHRNHHIFLAQSFYPSCHYSTNTIKVQAKMELTLLYSQTLVLIQTVAKWKWWILFCNEIHWYYLEDFVLATFWSIIWRFDAKSENPKGPVLVAFDKYCQMLHLLIFCQNLTPHMLSTSHNAQKSQKKKYEI